MILGNYLHFQKIDNKTKKKCLLEIHCIKIDRRVIDSFSFLVWETPRIQIGDILSCQARYKVLGYPQLLLSTSINQLQIRDEVITLVKRNDLTKSRKKKHH